MQNHDKCHGICSRDRYRYILYKCTGSAPRSTTLIEMEQTKTPIKIKEDNTTANTFSSKTLQQKWYKAINRRFYCIHDRYAQGKFKLFYRPGATNLGDYHTKHHSPSHHRLIHHKYLHTENLINQLKVRLMQGYVNSPVRADSYALVNSLVHTY